MLITKKRGKYKRKIGSTKGPCPSLVERIWASFTCCEYCGISTFEAFIGFDERGHQYWHRTFGVDRIRPGAVGGLYEPDNVTLACSSCNSRKGKRDFIGPVRSLTTMEALLNKKYGDHRWGWPTMASYSIWYPCKKLDTRNSATFSKVRGSANYELGLHLRRKQKNRRSVG